MLHVFIWFSVLVFSFAFPVSASTISNEVFLDGHYSSVYSEVQSLSFEDPSEASDGSSLGSEGSDMPVLFAASGSLSGGYYFVCKCALGNAVTFYVPLEWAHDVFALDSSGNLVNLSNTTCYAYCPDFPEYTFSCSRFGTFVYRGDGYNSSDLQITVITDTNLSLAQSDGVPFSDRDISFLVVALLFLIMVILIIRRG